MVRPRKCRRINNPNGAPRAKLFKPQGVPMRGLEIILLKHDEIEALRLRDLEGLSQTEAAKRMDISQSTFQRILKTAQTKLSRAIIKGYAIQLEDSGA